ncbi:hypothetical protein ACO22_06124 [Paracoccidioides brasiliensis]|uniref:Protein kinase domain-containing protein n=1 Tax=Paracoccidioides brasiliensis TaxID=121759 RepID=A0A1D2J8H1_PARBR|nr:hypothetical protein ACO22_06124 [Paracoccidioides brasiliensis]
MESMKNGDLAAHLKAQHPTRSLQLSWFRQMVSTLARIHDSHVFVEDTARKNFLLSDDLSVKLCDFTEATILPLDADMKAAGYNRSMLRILTCLRINYPDPPSTPGQDGKFSPKIFGMVR